MFLEDIKKIEALYKWGTRLSVGYLAQEIHFEEDDISILDYFMKEHAIGQGAARKELAKALFIRDDVLKKIKVLSGGEKSKLKLCSLTYNQTNLLILDEPTNHLDIDSREVLEEMLDEFNGTILFISHDRYFIKKIATRIGEIENKQITYYEGDYDYFRSIKANYKEESKPKKVKKEKNANTKKEIQNDYYSDLEDIESELLRINKSMKENGFDLEKLKNLQAEKEIRI
jgi:ATPase subunit of ABC transporter with duplicated ATPase domains